MYQGGMKLCILVMLSLCGAAFSQTCSSSPCVVNSWSALRTQILSAPTGTTFQLAHTFDATFGSNSGIILGWLGGASKRFSVEGNGKVIDGSSSIKAFFSISNGAELTLRNITLQNAKSRAVSVSSKSTLNLYNCVFLKNVHYAQRGGAVFVTGSSTLNAHSCTFRENSPNE